MHMFAFYTLFVLGMFIFIQYPIPGEINMLRYVMRMFSWASWNNQCWLEHRYQLKRFATITLCFINRIGGLLTTKSSLGRRYKEMVRQRSTPAYSNHRVQPPGATSPALELQGATYALTMEFTEDYPSKPPKCKFAHVPRLVSTWRRANWGHLGISWYPSVVEQTIWVCAKP